MKTATATVTFRLHSGPRTTGGGAGSASFGIATFELELVIPQTDAERHNLIDDRAAQYAALFA